MKYNLLLKKFAYEAYRARPVLPPSQRTNYRIERVNGGLLCDLWFLTAGCTHDASGGCVMCNYGKNNAPVTQAEEDRILEELRRIVSKLPWDFEDFLLTSSGSLLDPREVSPRMREGLLDILKPVRAKRLIIETRAETVTDEGLRFLKQFAPGNEKYVEIGLESSNDWVLQHCLNKGSFFADFCGAVQRIHAHGLCVTANVGLGFPFMSERASIEHAAQSVRDAFQVGADSVVLLPYHVKQGTLMDVMFRHGMYQCVSLWSLVEVLHRFPEEADRLQISWYKDYFGPEYSFIRSSPRTCPSCAGDVMEELDRYRNDPCRARIDHLSEYPCVCHEAWQMAMDAQQPEVDLRRVEALYRRLAEVISVEPSLLERELSRLKHEYGAWVK